MKIHTSDKPAKLAGEHISKILNEHKGDSVCLLSGGSALAVVEYINLAPRTFDQHDRKKEKNECRTIFMMGDERVSGEPLINNYRQLQTRYPDHPVTVHAIPTVPEANESAGAFADRVEKIFFEKYLELWNVKTIALLGIGTDGHTAGIFPMAGALFAKTYRDDSIYVPVQAEGLTIDSRASFTPAWLLDRVDAIIGFVVGTGKRSTLESLLKEDKELNERPAEIFKLHRNAHLYTDISLQEP